MKILSVNINGVVSNVKGKLEGLYRIVQIEKIEVILLQETHVHWERQLRKMERIFRDFDIYSNRGEWN